MSDIIPAQPEQPTALALPPKELNHTISFFDPNKIEDALEAAGWNVGIMIRELVGIIKDETMYDAGKGTLRPAVSAKEKMAAMILIKDVVQDSVTEKVTGRLARELPGGTTATMDIESVRLMKEGSAKTLSTIELLEKASTSGEIIDLEETENGSGKYSTVSRTDDGTTISGDGVAGRSDSGGCSGDGGSVVGPVHGGERPCDDEQGGLSGNDTSPTTGAEDERGTRVSEQLGRGIEGEESGSTGSKPVSGNQRNPDTSGWWNDTDREPDPSEPEPERPAVPFVPGASSGGHATATQQLWERFGKPAKDEAGPA